MMKKFKFTALALSAVLAVTGLVGCGGQKAAEEPEGPVTITISNDFHPDETLQPEAYAEFEEQLKKFEDMHPDINVELANWAYDTQTYMVMAEGNTLPTIYKLPLTEAEKVAELGYAADLTEEYKSRGYDAYLTETGEKNICRDGKYYYVPSWNTYSAILVNLDLYKEAGFVAEDGTLYQPTDWEDLARVAKEIKDKTGVPGFLIPSLQNQGGWRTTPMAWSYGVDFMEKDENGKWQAKFNTPEYAEVLKLIHKMKWEDNSLPASTMYDYGKTEEALASGDVAMSFGDYDYASDIITRCKMDKDKMGALSIPAGPKGKIAMMSGSYYTVDRNATPGQIKAAFEWLEFMGIGPALSDTTKENKEISLQQKIDMGDMIGLEFLSFWNDDAPAVKFQKELDSANINVDIKHIENHNNQEGLEFKAEEPVDAQALYSLIDSMIQEVLNNKDADIETLISNAASDFQKNNLDYAN